MPRNPIARWGVLSRGTPGRRFRDRYHRNQRSTTKRGWWRRIVRFVLAALAFAVGLVLTVLPGPAIVFFLLAGALLATDWLWLAKLMDWLEVKARIAWAWARSLWRRLPRAGRIAVMAAGVSLSAASTYGVYCLMR